MSRKKERNTVKREPIPTRPGRRNGPFHPAVIVGLLALLVRAVVTYDYSRSIFWSSVWMDSATYNDWAKGMVASGDWIGSQPFFMTPFYPYFLAVLYALFGTDLAVVRIAQVLLGAGTAVLIYYSARRLFGNTAALIAGLIAALYGPLVFFVNLLLVETVKVFCVTLSFQLALRAADSGRWKDHLWTGLTLGAAILCRPTDGLMLLPIFLLLFVVRPVPRPAALRSVGALLLGVALLVAPVTLRNYLLSGELIAVTSNGGLNFYLGNNAQAVGVFYNPEQFNMVYDPNGSGYLQHLFARPFTHGETSAHWMGKAMEFVAGHPAEFLSLMARKTVLFFHYKEIGQLGYGYDFMARYISALLPWLPVFVIVLPLAMLGMTVTRRRWRELWLLHGFLWMQVVGVVLFFITDRYRLSAMPFFIIFAGAGTEWLWRMVREQQRTAIMKGGAVMLAAVLGATLFNFHMPDNFATEYYNIGQTYFDAKRYPEAVTAYRTSLSIHESHAVYNSLGNVYAAVGELGQAKQLYLKAYAMNPSEAVSLFSIGTLFVRQQLWDSALVYYDRTLAVNPRFAPAHLNKGLALYYLQRFAQALPELEAYVALETDRTKTASVQNDIEQLRRMLAVPPRP